jgi:L-threonylcarbamoyladenylate synthase
VIAYPTEAVWGYGCDPFNARAVQRLLDLKQRDWRKGLIVVAANEAQLEPLLAPLTLQQRQLLRQRWPGPVTWVVPDQQRWLPHWVKGQHGSVAVRVSAHPVVQTLCLAWGGPLISTSANRSGQPPARTELAMRRQLRLDAHDLQPDLIVPGATLGLAKPTAIYDLLSQRLVRQG